MRGRRDRDAVGGRFPAAELPAPAEGVERVVVGEGDARDEAEQRPRPRRSPIECAQAPAQSLDRCPSRGGRYPLRGASSRSRGPDRLSRRCPQSSSQPSRSDPSTAVTGPAASPTSWARSRSCGRCATPWSGKRSTTPISSWARAGTGKTSMAKILAACLNCEQGPTIEPCGQLRFVSRSIAAARPPSM